MPEQLLRHGQPMHTRALSRAPSSVDADARTFSAVVSTETPVRRWLLDPRGSGRMIEVDEVLKASGARLAREGGVYLVDSHKTYTSIRDALGKIRAARTEGAEVVADVKILTPGADLMPGLAEGDYDQFSVGYRYDPKAAVLQERAGDVPLLTVGEWLIDEVSMVAVAADPNTSVRSADATQENEPMDFEAAVTAAEQAAATLDTALEALEAVEAGEASDEVKARAAAVVARKRAAEAPAETAPAAVEAPAVDDGEKAAIEAVRSIAKSYGADVEKLASDAAALGSTAAEVRSIVLEAVKARAAAAVKTDVEPAPQKQRSSEGPDYRNINDRFTGRAK